MLLVATSNNGETGVLACDITELPLFNIFIHFGCALMEILFAFKCTFKNVESAHVCVTKYIV